MSNVSHIAVLTGAGMSADSGLQTFRDAGGLWEGHEISKVATPEAWQRDPETVLKFYNERRAQADQVEPHEGHKALAKLDDYFNVHIITQNVDSLHEKAGSENVLHLHGQLSKVRSEKDTSLIKEIGGGAIHVGDTAEDGAQLRPHVVWFGEPVPNMKKAAAIMPEADILIVIGTSLVVYPAAGLIEYVQSDISKHIVDPDKPELHDFNGWTHIQDTAEVGTPKLVNKLVNTH